MNTDAKPTRVLARHVIANGKDWGLAVVEISADGSAYSITPFQQETANTVYYNGTVSIEKSPRGWSLRYC